MKYKYIYLITENTIFLKPSEEVIIDILINVDILDTKRKDTIMKYKRKRYYYV